MTNERLKKSLQRMEYEIYSTTVFNSDDTIHNLVTEMSAFKQ